MRQNIIAGNWKMNGTLDETTTLINRLKTSHNNSESPLVVVCPPFTSLETAHKLLETSSIQLGAQDMSEYDSGAYTGEVSAKMLLTVGATFVIIGHSERRQYHSETDDLINRKAHKALQSGLSPIICVGETIDQRNNGETEEIVGRQVEGTLSGIKTEEMEKVVIAYEPVWAIGTGKTATPEMAQDVHKFIRDQLRTVYGDVADKVRILYGGSVKADNAAELLAQPDIDGALVGGASLKADDFMTIINSVELEVT